MWSHGEIKALTNDLVMRKARAFTATNTVLATETALNDIINDALLALDSIATELRTSERPQAAPAQVMTLRQIRDAMNVHIEGT